MMFFEGCTALITGASSGLGAEFARQLAPQARALVLVARRMDRLEALRDELVRGGSAAAIHVYGADLSSEGQRTALVNWLPTQGLKVNFLINNAGLGDKGPFESGDWGRVRAMIDVNMAAVTHLIYLLLPAMTRRGRAAILNVSSVAGFFPLPNTAVYSATKAYVTSLSEALGIELRPRGITVTALCPGPVPTGFFGVARRTAADEPHTKTMPAFTVSAEEAVRSGLRGVARERARVIPGLFLCVSVTAALAIPFLVVREVLRAIRGRL